MRFSRIRRFQITDSFILVVFLLQGCTSTPDDPSLKPVSSYNTYLRKKVELPVNFDNAEHSEEKSQTSEDKKETRLVTRGPLGDFALGYSSLGPEKAITSEDIGHDVEHDGMKHGYDQDFNFDRSRLGWSEGQAEILMHEPVSKEASDSQKSKRKTAAQVVRGWFSSKLKNAKDRGNNENSGKRWFNFWPSSKSQTPSPISIEDKPVAKPADANSRGGWLSKWSPKSQTPPPPTKEDKPAAKGIDDSSEGESLSKLAPKFQSPPLPAKEDQTTTKRTGDNSGKGWLSNWLQKYQTPLPPAKKDQTEAKPADDNTGGGWFSNWSPGSQASPPPAEEQETAAKRAGDRSNNGLLSMWSPSKSTPPPSSTKEENLTEKHVNDDSRGGWLGMLSPKSLPPSPSGKAENPVAKRADDTSGGGWLGGLWSPPSTPTPVPAPKVPDTPGGLGGWFSSSPENVAATEGKTDKKPHGRVREFVKSVEHIVPKNIRRSIKSIPGVRPSRKVMKSTLDVVDRAVDSVVDNDYVKNIKEAGKISSKRVGVKAVNLADSVLELGTGTSEATLKMAATLQKEGARTLDSVGTAIPPAKPAVDYVNTKMADGVASLQEHNDRLRKGGKSVLTSISDYANLKEVADSKEIVNDNPSEKKKPDSNSWFSW